MELLWWVTKYVLQYHKVWNPWSVLKRSWSQRDNFLLWMRCQMFFWFDLPDTFPVPSGCYRLKYFGSGIKEGDGKADSADMLASRPLKINYIYIGHSNKTQRKEKSALKYYRRCSPWTLTADCSPVNPCRWFLVLLDAQMKAESDTDLSLCKCPSDCPPVSWSSSPGLWRRPLRDLHPSVSHANVESDGARLA